MTCDTCTSQRQLFSFVIAIVNAQKKNYGIFAFYFRVGRFVFSLYLMTVGHYRRMRHFVVKLYFAWFLFISTGNAVGVVDIAIRSHQQHAARLPKFWAHTGLCPPAPTNDAFVLNAFFSGKSMRLCMELISVLPNSGLQTVRIHWLLNLIRVV